MTSPSTSKVLLTALYMIYYSIMMVMILFGLVVLYLNISEQKPSDPDDQFAQVLLYVLYAMALAGVLAGHFIFRQQLSVVDPALTLREKLGKLQVALLVRSACMEVPALFGAVAAMITGDNSFLLFTAIIVTLFIVWRPTLATVADDLGLSQQERSLLENPDAQIG